MAPRLKILMAFKSNKETQINFSFLSKVLANEPPPGSPTWPLWRERTIYRTFTYLSKTSSFRFLSKGAFKVLFMESLAERCPTTRVLLQSSVKVPSI
jgi:hypothetical protein